MTHTEDEYADGLIFFNRLSTSDEKEMSLSLKSTSIRVRFDRAILHVSPDHKSDNDQKEQKE